ncbi:MAG: hypothetical protein KDL87_02695 [Verrucomicrobiae bacterium]|nr:hypothetical protein [Verrucomicrobiae bacterium]
MPLFRSCFTTLAILGGTAFLVSCETDAPVARPPVTFTPPPAPSLSIPPTFLATDYQALANWLDERYEVEYRNLTPEMVFEQSPLNKIKYQTSRLPENAPVFHLRSSDISCREILYKVATFWDLDMTLLADENGTPAAVQVTGR